VKRIIVILLVLVTGNTFAQSVTVLPQNGSYNQNTAPQGRFRYQRQFYLIKAAELQKAGLQNNMVINSIGFTNGVAQYDSTRGSFKVYLQNTSDTISRIDTSWTTVSSASNFYLLTGLVKGDYEWQVQSVCPPQNSVDTGRSSFSNNNLSACNAPTNLATDDITSISATFHWVAPASAGITKYVVQFTRSDTVNWITDTVTGTSKSVSGLIAGKNYQWQVKTVCASGFSDFVLASFMTEPTPAGCNPPSSLAVGTLTNNSAAISWTAATGASHFGIQYRRTGTTAWLSQFAFTTSATLAGLQPGTTYEWKVRTVCTLGNGTYVQGTPFTTTGPTTCYAPTGLSADNLTDSTARLTWVSTGASSYTIRYRLKEFINWSGAFTNMTLVHNDSITIPKTVGSYDIPFVNGTTFTYTGGGVYVAYEYTRATGAIASIPNTGLCTTGNTIVKGSYGQDSLRYVLSFGANKQDTLPGILPSANFRPETRFGSPGLQDSVEVAAVYALGNNAFSYGNPTPISALIKNLSDADHNYDITLIIKDQLSNAVKFGPVVQSVSVSAHSAGKITFAGWSPSAAEKDSIIVSVGQQANENVVSNNRNYYLQNNNSAIIGYDDGSNALTHAGLDSLPGLILTRYHMNGCGKINGVQVFLSASAKGHAVYAVAVDTSRTIIAVSSPFTPDSTQVNKYHTFYFATSPLLRNVDYYVGVAQSATAATNGYFPVGSQWENGYTRDSAYYTAKLNGDSITNHPAFGRLMIKAEIVPGVPSPAIAGNLVLCTGTTATLMASSIDRRFADSVIAYSTQTSSVQYSANTVLGTPDVYPNYGINTNAWVSSSADGRREYMTLRFPNPAPINVVEIYETFNPGAVDTIFVKNPGTGNYDIVYSATAKAAPALARRNRISFATTDYNVSEIRIAIASDSVNGYNSIDAVAIGQLTTPGAFSSYLWTPGGETSQAKDVTVAGGYKLTVTDGIGCSGSDSVTVITPVQTPPVVSSSGNTTFCQGDSIWLRSDKKGGNTWSTGATTDSIKVKIAGSYSVTYDDGTGCGITTSLPVVVTVNDLPVVSLSGTPGICPSSSTTLTAVVTGTGNTFLWSNGNTSSTNVISVPGPVSVLVTNSSGCKTSANTTTFYVSKPVPHILGNTALCPGGSTDLNAGTGYSSYTWSNGQTGTAIISVNAPARYYVTVTNIYGCSGADTANVVQHATPVPFITGGLSLCAGPTTLNAGGGYSAYLWSTGETTQTINVNAAGNFAVTVTDIFGCTGSNSVSTTKDSLPAAPGPIIGDINGVCNSPGMVFTINPVPNTTHYVWFVPPGVNIVSGQGDTSIVLAFDGSFTEGDLVVAASNACGQSGSWHPRILPLNGEPANPTVINGETSGVCGQTRIYSTPAIPFATSYTWTTSPGIMIAGGQGSSSVTLSFANTFVSGNICVKANNSCGSSEELCIPVNGRPATPGAITGPSAVCFRQSNVIYSIPAVPGAASYNWTVPQQATIVSGQGTTSIRVNFGNKSGNIVVTAANNCGSSLQSLAIVATNCPGARTNTVTATNLNSSEKKMEPEIIANDGGVNVHGNMQIEWTLGEPLIETVVTGNRLYTQGFHQPIILKSQKTAEIVLQNENDLKIIAVPNPVQYTLRVTFSSKQEQNLVLRLTEMNGKVLLVKPLRGSAGTLDIDMSAYSGGMYLLNIQSVNDGFSRNIKVVKVN